MIEKLLLWFQGYVICYMKGYSIERFINLCRSKGVNISDIKKSAQGYEFQLTLKDYRNIRPIARKTKAIPYIKKRCGLPFLLHRYRKRQGLFLGILMFLVLLFVMSRFIWDISIIGGYKYTKEALLEFVNENGIYTGMMQSDVDCQQIEEKIRLRYSDISWVSAEVKGTRLIIKFTETNMPIPKQTTREPSNIVATKPGIITSMITRNGTPQVKIGDVVREGDILVSGVVDVVGDFDTLIRKKTVVADADIICKSYYNYNESYPLHYKKKCYTGKQKSKYVLQLFQNKISLYNPRISYDSYDIIMEESVLKLSWNFYLPIRYQVTTYKEYQSKDEVYSKEEAIKIVMIRLKEYLDNLVANDVQIIENQVKIQMDSKTCTASGKIIVYESCWDYQRIQESEWRDNNTDELNGDNH